MYLYSLQSQFLKYQNDLVKQEKWENRIKIKIDNNQVFKQNIRQLQTYDQQFHNICGFHTISAIIEYDANNWDKIKVKQNFIKNYQIIRKFLISKLKNENDEQAIQSYEPFQRSYLDLIIQHQKQLDILAQKQIAYLTFGYRYIQNSEQSLQMLLNKIGKLRKGQIERLFVILGVSIHWCVMVINFNHGNLEFIYLDSMNYPLKYILQKDMNSLTNLFGKLQKSLQNFFIDLKQTVEILLDLVYEKRNIIDIKFQNQLSEMLVSFDQIEKNQNDIRIWFKEQYHPVVIKNDIIVLMVKCKKQSISLELIEKLKVWVSLTQTYKIMDTTQFRTFLE